MYRRHLTKSYKEDILNNFYSSFLTHICVQTYYSNKQNLVQKITLTIIIHETNDICRVGLEIISSLKIGRPP